VRSNQLSYGPDLIILGKRNEDGDDRHISARTGKPDRTGRISSDGHLTGAIYVLKRRFCLAWIACPFRLRSRGTQAGHAAGPAKNLFLRKEVIQPQVPLRLPCYDFTPVADPTVVACLLAVSAAPSGRTNSHGVTGGVYKARERIHRGMLIRDY
jgi:hypothetical protein